MNKLIKNLEKLQKIVEIMWKMPFFVHFKPQIIKK